jgi:hypothetical protein
LHIAAFAGHSDVLLYIMSLKHRWHDTTTKNNNNCKEMF